MTSEIVILITELRNKQRITLPAGSYRFGRSAQCEYVLRRNNVGDHQFTVSFADGQWGVTDGGSDYRTWYNNRYLEPGETSILQSGDVIGLNTDGDADTQEITFRVEEITSVQGDGMAPKKEQTTDAVLRETDIRRKRRVLIGRGDDCDIKLVNDRVSRHHCEILYKDGHYELHDLGSTNGTYVDGILIVNKSYPLSADYDPGLQPETKAAFQELCDAAAAEGMDIYDGSDYRDYSYQVKIYHNYCSLYGWEKADTFSARPGYSEHQSGLTIDCNTIDDAFGETQEAAWLAEHCADYGFIIRFPKGKEAITGYKYEPWHIRYTGIGLASSLTLTGMTLEEYYERGLHLPPK